MDDDYRIVRLQYFNEKAVVSIERWIIERRVRGWFGKRWRRLRREYGDDEFDSLDDARACIQRLKSGAPRHKWTRAVIP